MAEKTIFTPEALRELIDLGEGQFLELKGTWSYEQEPPTPLPHEAVRKQVAENVAAFANADGGTLVVGVEDDGIATGHGRTEAEVEQLILVPERRIRSTVSYDHQLLEFEGESVLVFEVGRSPRAVMVGGNGFPYRNGDQTLLESEEWINSLKDEYSHKGFEQRLADANAVDIDRGLLPDGAASDDWLVRHGLLLNRRGSLAVTNAAVLLAGNQPSVRWHAHQTLRIHRVDGIERRHGSEYNAVEVERLELPIAELIPAAYDILRREIGSSERLHDLFFREVPEYPTFAWQEAIVNAVAHRDYADQGRGIEVWLYDDRMEVVSPGAPIAPVSVERLNEGRGVHASRNPLIARVLTELGLMREAGEGIPRMIEEMERSFLRRPEFVADDHEFKVVLRNTPIFETPDDSWRHIVERLTRDENQMRVLLAHPEGFTNEQFREVNSVDRDSAYQQIQSMVGSGIVLSAERPGRGAVYRLSPDLMESRAWLDQRLPVIRGYFSGHDRLTNSDYRSLFDVTRETAKSELGRLVDEGVLVMRGSRRGAHYVPSKELRAGAKEI